MSYNVGEAIVAMPNNDEIERVPEYELVCIAPDGVGYGEGAVSAVERENHPEYPVSREQRMRAVEIISNNYDRVIVAIQEPDDGCGDGRPTEQIQQVDSETGEKHDYKVSKLRAKIFGGGLQVAASMWRAVSGQPQSGETVLGDRMFIAAELKARGVLYGAHTDNHAQGDSCGCGAIDKYPTTTQMSGKYRNEITSTLGVFYDDPAANSGVEQAFATRAAIAQDAEYMANASGRQTMDFIIEDGAVVKELGNEHLEAIVVFNEESGTTVDQTAIAALLREVGLPDKIQVFVVDVWRGREYAETVADIAAERGYDREQAQQTALADFFVNQLSVSTTLTKGDLPVVINQPKLA